MTSSNPDDAIAAAQALMQRLRNEEGITTFIPQLVQNKLKAAQRAGPTDEQKRIIAEIRGELDQNTRGGGALAR